MATIVAACVAVAGAAKGADDKKKAGKAASDQALATHNQNQACQIAQAYAGSMKATTMTPNMFDMMRAGGMTGGIGAGGGGGMGGGGLGTRAVMGQSGSGDSGIG